MTVDLRPEIQVRHRCYVCGWQVEPDEECTTCSGSGYTYRWLTLSEILSDVAAVLEEAQPNA